MFIHSFKKAVIALSLVLILFTTAACSGATATDRRAAQPGISQGYGQVQRGNSVAGQDFGTKIVQSRPGIIQDAYVRGTNTLGVVISSKVRPEDVRGVAKSLAREFRSEFPNRDLKVLVYAPDKKLILTSRYSNATNQIEFDVPNS